MISDPDQNQSFRSVIVGSHAYDGIYACRCKFEPLTFLENR